MVIVLPNRNSLVYHWLYNGSSINMNITQLEEQIIKAVDIEIDTAGSVGINDNNYYDPNIELQNLKKFIKKCFKEYKNEG